MTECLQSMHRFPRQFSGIGIIAVLLSVSACAGPAAMTLQSKTWVWLETSYNDDTVHTPNKVEAFTLTFADGNRLNATTDCNRMNGSYQVTNNQIALTQMASTRMFCEGSQESVFVGMLENVGSYFIDDRGRLILELKYDSGSMIFR